MQDTPSRRTLAKGAAWSIPAVAAASTVPAFAASGCTPTASFSGGFQYDFGYKSNATSNQQVGMGGEVFVQNLPAGVTVKSITQQWFIQNHIGQTSRGDGAFFLGNSSTNYYKSGQCTAVGCTVTWVAQPPANTGGKNFATAPAAGWTNKVTNTQNLKDTVFPNGKTYPAWDAILTWAPGSGSESYTNVSGGCRNFQSGDNAGYFGVTYTNIPTVPTGGQINAYVHIVVTLSNGQQLTDDTGTVITS